MADLRSRAEEYKIKKARKIERRAKWENWKKTQAMFYCKTSTNYRKWDMFESESDSEKEEDPIVNEEDPQIKAMAQDFKDRHQRRVRSKKIASIVSLFVFKGISVSEIKSILSILSSSGTVRSCQRLFSNSTSVSTIL